MVKGSKMGRNRFWENVILTAIILVIAHTFLSDLAVLLRWSIDIRTLIIFAGLFFDMLFTVEFIVRSAVRAGRKKLFTYWVYERGWVDFLSSVPLLLLSSGPQVFILLSSGAGEGLAAIGALNILKIVKAIRVTRVLRLIRVMKIFGKIKNADSKMAQHHTATISTTAVSIVLFVILIFTFLVGDPLGKAASERRTHYEDLIAVVDEKTGDGGLVADILAGDEFGLRLAEGDTVLFTKIPPGLWDASLSYEDYILVQKKGYELAVSLEDINRKSALYNIRIFSIIIALVAGFMLFYTRHFVLTISDVLFVILRGFRERGYTLQVKIPKEYEDHEIFDLARFYNERYLPAKLKNIHKSKQMKQSSLSMKDLFKFGKQ